MFDLLLLAQQVGQAQPQISDEEAAWLAGAGLAVICGSLLIGLAIVAVICYLLSSVLKGVPQEHRQMEPGMVWLLLIPLFNLFWVFMVVIKISDSLKSYFDSQGRTDVGDCGKTIGLFWGGCAVAGIVPYLNCLAGPASLVLMIIYIVKTMGLKNEIATAAPTVPPQPM